MMHVLKDIPFNQYEVRWSRAINYTNSGLKLKQGPEIANNMDGDNQPTLVQQIGNHANSKKGISLFDQIVGIQTAHVTHEPTATIERCIQESVHLSGNNRAVVLRFQHNSNKFKALMPLEKKEQEEKGTEKEYEILFTTHPLDGGLEIIERKSNAEPATTFTEARVHNVFPGSFAEKHAITESDTVIGIGDYDVRGVDYPSVFHAMKYAQRPVKIRFRRHVEEKLSKKAPEGCYDVSVKKSKINSKLFFDENEEDGGGYVAKVSKLKPIKKGMTLIGLNGLNIQQHEWSYVQKQIETSCAQKKPKELAFRFGKKITGMSGMEDDYDEDNDGGISLRMMLKMKKKYKATKKDVPCAKNQYDVVFEDGPVGLQLCIAPQQKKGQEKGDEGKEKGTNETQVGAIVYSTLDMSNEFQKQITCGDRICLINKRNVEAGNYSEIDSLLFEQLGATKITIRFTKREVLKAPELIGDTEKEIDLEMTKDELFQNDGVTPVTFTASYENGDDSTYCCVLEQDPETGTSMKAMGLTKNCRVIAYDGISTLNIPTPGILLHIDNVRQGYLPSTTLRYQSKQPIVIPEEMEDLPLETDQLEFMVLEGSLGISLKENEDYTACVVGSVQENGQGNTLGIKTYDEFISVNNQLIPNDETAFDVVMAYLQSEPRPCRIVVYRSPDTKVKFADHGVNDQEEEEDFNMDDNQAMDGDMDDMFNDIQIPEDEGEKKEDKEKEKEKVKEKEKEKKKEDAKESSDDDDEDLHQPLTFQGKQQEMKYDEFPRPKKKSDASRDDFAKNQMIIDQQALWLLPDQPSSLEYTVRWKQAKQYRKNPITFGPTIVHPKYGYTNTEVLNHGDKTNLKKGVSALDRLVGIQNTLVKEEPHEKVQSLLDQALAEAGHDKQLVLRFEHHEKKFTLLIKKVNKNRNEIDVTFSKHPLDMGLQIMEMKDPNDANNSKGPLAVISHVEDKSYSDIKTPVTPGMIVIGIEGRSMEGIPFNIVDHMLHYVEEPCVLRLMKHAYVQLNDAVELEQKDVELMKSDYVDQKIEFDTHSSIGQLLVKKTSLPNIHLNEMLVGIDGIDISKMLLHSQVLYMLKEKSRNLNDYNNKKDKKFKTITLRMKLRAAGISLEEDDSQLENERSELSNAEAFEDIFGPKKSKISVNMMLKLKKKFKKGKLGKMEANQYEIALSNTHGLELCGGPSEDETISRQEGSVVYHKDKMTDKKVRRQLKVGDRVVGVDGMDMYSAEHHEVDYVVFEKLKRGKRIIRMQHVEMKELSAEKAEDEIDVNLTYEDVMHIPWTGKTDFDACIKDELDENHPARIAGLGKGDRLIGIAGKDVRNIPFNGVLKYLKKVESDHKTHLLRFKNLPDDYWHDFYEKQAASM